MTPAQRWARGRRKFSFLLHRWHRRIGVAVSLFVIWMAVSGWLLNHTAALNLAQREWRVHWLTQHYGIAAEIPTHAFFAQRHWLVAVQERWLLDGKPIEHAGDRPLGLAMHGEIVFVATATHIVLLTPSGALIDDIAATMLPAQTIQRIGNGCEGIVIEADEKLFTTGDGASWNTCNAAVQWADTAPLSPEQIAMIEPLLQPGISAEKLLQDLHSGRFFGAWGPYVVDALGFAFVLLALSGLWMFAHQRQRRRDAQR